MIRQLSVFTSEVTRVARVPDILRAKVKVFAELYRKSRQLAVLNRELEERVADRTAELEKSNARLKESEEQLKLATEAAEIGYWDIDPVSDTSFWSPHLRTMLGMSFDAQASALDLYDRVHQEDQDRVKAAFAAACDPLKRTRLDIEVRVVGCEDGRVRWLSLKGQSIFTDSDTCTRIVGTAVDISARKRAEEYQVLLAREVDHRAKNALAVVQSIIQLTRAPTVEAYVKAIDGRVKALNRVHTLLSEARWQSAGLRRIVHDELAPFSAEWPGRIVVDGADVSLQPTSAQCLALVFHELATNSAKYGALSAPRGNVRVSWSNRHDKFSILWEEHGGPVVSPPATNGFGLTVVCASVESQLRGKVALDWRPGGLICQFTLPPQPNAGPEESKVARLERQDAIAAVSRSTERPRILVVEDESLVALMVREALIDAAFDVVATCASVPDALAAAKTQILSCAVLDINLDGAPIYPVAEYLTAKGVPFLFMTGYSGEHVDRRFLHIPVLQKPLNLDQLRAKMSELCRSTYREPMTG